MRKRILAMASAALLGGCSAKTFRVPDDAEKTVYMQQKLEEAKRIDAAAQPNDLVHAIIPYSQKMTTVDFNNVEACYNAYKLDSAIGSDSSSPYSWTCVRQRDGAGIKLKL